MATGVTANAQFDDALKTFLDEAQFVSDHEGVGKKVVDTRRLPRKMGKIWNEPYFGAIGASALTDGVEFDSPVQITDNKLQVTPSEAGVQVLWTKRTDYVISEDFARIAAKMMGDALEYYRDQQIIALFDGFSTSLGGATTTMTVGLISAAVTSVRGGRTGTTRTGARTTGDPLPPPYYAVIHPHHIHDISMQLGGVSGGAVTSAVTTGAMTGNFAGQSLSDYNKRWLEENVFAQGPMLGGAKVYVDGNFTLSSSAAKCGAFSKQALVHVEFQDLQNYMVDTVDGRAIRQTMWIDFGVGERADNGGVEIHSDATAPLT